MSAGQSGGPPKEVAAPPPSGTATYATTRTDEFTSLTDVALELHRRGFHTFPCDHPGQPTCIGRHGSNAPCDGQRGKHPAVKWSVWSQSPVEKTITWKWGEFGGLANVGIACGPSNLVVLDEDAPGEVDRWCAANKVVLPSTYMVATGRAGGGRHLYFRWDHTDRPIGNSAKVFAGHRIDVRGDGGYVVAEGSLHASGAVYAGNGMPVADLPAEVAELLMAGQGSAPSTAETNPSPDFLAGTGDPAITVIPAGGRHAALVAYAGRLRKRGLDLGEAETLFRARWELCEQPPGDLLGWDAALAKLRDVFERYPSGEAPTPAQSERPVYPSPNEPLEVARVLYERYRTADGTRTLVAWRGGWMRWTGPHWSEIETAALRAEVYDALGGADRLVPVKEGGYETQPWSPNKRRVTDVLEALAAVGHLSSDTDQPSWIDSHDVAGTPATQMVACRNGLLNLSDRQLTDHDPALFNGVSVPFDYRPDAPKPVAWLEFLRSLWDKDTDSVALLQEFIGYALSGRTDMQKMLLMTGPTRSGKGTIARLLAALIGRGHVAAPTLASLGANFGLAPLLGRPLAIVSDARMGDGPAHAIVERLLSISGEDLLTVDRKYREPWSGKLPTRFVILSNELPRFRDASAAITGRLLILQTRESFLGREDRTLDERLAGELPGILNWALTGLDRLVANGRFTVPASSHDAAALMADLASPVAAFVRDRCDRKPSAAVTVDALFASWKSWCEDNGHHAGAKSTLGRNLRAVAPEVHVGQPRVDGVQVRQYFGIELSDGLGTHDDPGDGPADTGNPVSETDIKPQVNGVDTGDTGETPFYIYTQELASDTKVTPLRDIEKMPLSPVSASKPAGQGEKSDTGKVFLPVSDRVSPVSAPTPSSGAGDPCRQCGTRPANRSSKLCDWCG